jgi:hypothetical protein
VKVWKNQLKAKVKRDNKTFLKKGRDQCKISIHSSNPTLENHWKKWRYEFKNKKSTIINWIVLLLIYISYYVSWMSLSSDFSANNI